LRSRACSCVLMSTRARTRGLSCSKRSRCRLTADKTVVATSRASADVRRRRRRVGIADWDARKHNDGPCLDGEVDVDDATHCVRNDMGVGPRVAALQPSSASVLALGEKLAPNQL
jgi:hypothetical protein